ncbi:MAG: alpha/beta hydrolase [Candidatus Sphingomonas phytovorans]|nr:alpha/beta hydrolase [Sphingomonas sp.]WEK02300.1 MAG: alpha/beta hydrolase [Sphingomonas sp.]
MTIGSTHLVRGIGTWLACLWCCCSPAQGQVPPAIKQAILTGGRTVDGHAMAELYGPLQEHEPYRGIIVARDVGYGPFEQQLADVFVEKRQGQRKRPVLIFVHGGGFTAGARRLSRESPFYDNVALWAARHGFVAISINYRLAPAATWPAAAEDIGTAVRWARANAASYGGNPDRLFLMGHSAGATHVASYGADRTLWRGDTPGVRGMIVISGSFTVEAPETAPAADRPLLTRAKAYFGSDPDKFAAESSLNGLLASRTPLLLANAEFDPDYFLRQRQQFLSAVPRDRSRGVSSVMLAGHNHMSEIYSINTSDKSLTREIITFVRRN